jgi:hypothetical protein
MALAYPSLLIPLSRLSSSLSTFFLRAFTSLMLLMRACFAPIASPSLPVPLPSCLLEPVLLPPKPRPFKTLPAEDDFLDWLALLGVAWLLAEVEELVLET